MAPSPPEHTCLPVRIHDHLTFSVHLAICLSHSFSLHVTICLSQQQQKYKCLLLHSGIVLLDSIHRNVERNNKCQMFLLQNVARQNNDSDCGAFVLQVGVTLLSCACFYKLRREFSFSGHIDLHFNLKMTNTPVV